MPLRIFLKRSLYLFILITLLGCIAEQPSSGAADAGVHKHADLGLEGTLYFYDPIFQVENVYSAYNLSSSEFTPLVKDLGRYISISQNESTIAHVDSTFTVLNIYDKNQKHLYRHDMSSIGYQFNSWPRFSPDGQFIAVIVNDIYNSIAIFKPNGELINRIDFKHIERGGDRAVRSVNWTPEGEIIFTVGGSLYHLPDIYTDDYKLIAEGLLNTGDNMIAALSMSPDGKKIAYISGSWYEQDGDLFIYDLKQKNNIQLTTHSGFYLLSWSPDGRYLAAAHGRLSVDDFCGSLWIFKSDQSSAVKITRLTESSGNAPYKIKANLDGKLTPLCPTKGLDWR